MTGSSCRRESNQLMEWLPPGQPARPRPRRELEILWRWFLKVSTLSSFVCGSPLGPPCPASRRARKSRHNSIRRLTRRPAPPGHGGARCRPVVPARPAAGHVRGREVFGGPFPRATHHSPNTICHFPPPTFWSHCFLSLQCLLPRVCLPRCYTLSKQDLRHRSVAGFGGHIGVPVFCHLQRPSTVS